MFAFISEKGNKENIYLLKPGNYNIGRRNDNDITVDEKTVSGHHAKLEVLKDKVFIEDLDSSNGTRLNSVKIIRKTRISLNQHIHLGRSQCYISELNKTDLKAYEKNNEDSYVRDKVVAPITKSKTKEPKLDDVIINKIDLKDASKKKQNIDKLITKKNESVKNNYAFQKLDILYKMSQELNNIMEEPELFKRTLMQIRNGIDYDRGYILLKEEDEIICKYNANENDEIVISKTIANKVINEQIGIITMNAAEDDRFDSSKSIADLSITSAMCVPFWVNEKPIGLIYIDNSISSQRFNNEDLKFLTAFSYQLSLSLERIYLINTLQEEEKIKSNLKRYFSPDIASVIIEDPSMLKLGGARTNVSVFFADIRGFTKLSLSTSVDLLVNMLNEYFTNLVSIIFKKRGSIDKFIGDAVMAFFGAPVSYKNYEWHAVESAIMIQKNIMECQKEWEKKYGFQLHIGIGISSGEVIAGNVGSTDKIEYTVIGNTVNLASRICSKAPEGEILICENTFKKCKGKITGIKMDKVKLKGIDKDVTIYKVNI